MFLRLSVIGLALGDLKPGMNPKAPILEDTDWLTDDARAHLVRLQESGYDIEDLVTRLALMSDPHAQAGPDLVNKVLNDIRFSQTRVIPS